MTYNLRIIENLPDTIADGSVAILIPKSPLKLMTKQKAFFPLKNTDGFMALQEIYLHSQSM
jgi:hypothetical protein